MTQILSTMRRSGRAAVIALCLGAAALPMLPAPVLAQSGPSASFQLRLGDGDRGMTMRFGDRHDRRRPRICLRDSEIRRGLRDFDFRDVRIVRERGRNRVEVVARQDRRWFLLRVDRCSGEVRILERLRRGGGGPRGGDFGLHFNFDL